MVRGKLNAESELKKFGDFQDSSARHEGWRYFIEKTDLKAGTHPVEAINIGKPNWRGENQELCGKQRLEYFLRLILRDEPVGTLQQC